MSGTTCTLLKEYIHWLEIGHILTHFSPVVDLKKERQILALGHTHISPVSYGMTFQRV